MPIFADVAGRSRMNSLRMARPSRHDNLSLRKLKSKIKKTVQKYNVQAIQSQRGQTISRGGQGYVSAPGALKPGSIFDYTSPEFRFQLQREAANFLMNTQQVNVGGNVNKQLNDKIYLRSDVTEARAEHEAIHALSGFIGDTPFTKTFFSQLSEKQQASIQNTYFATKPDPVQTFAMNLFPSKWEQEAPSVMWETMRDKPYQLSLIPKAQDYFAEFMNPTEFLTESERVQRWTIGE